MERLQEALKRARAQRAGTPTSSDTERVRASDLAMGAPDDGRAPVQVDDAWMSVPEFVPTPRIMRKNRLVAFFPGPEASAIDILRTKIIHQAKAKGARRILVTSPTPGCGKTTTSANLLLSLARQTDLRTIVIDIDLRRPMLGTVLGLKEPHQFSRVLAGEAQAADHMIRIGSNMLVATNSAPAKASSELLQSQAARQAIEALEATYKPDLVLFDALPILTSDDTIGFLEYCDAALIVAAAEENSIEELDVTEAEAAAVAPVLGVVLNKCRYATTSNEYY